MLIRHPQLSSWRTTLLVGLCLTSTLYIIISHSKWNSLGARSFQFSGHRSQRASTKDYISQLVPFWKELAIALEAAQPQCSPVQVSKEEMSSHDKSWEPLKQKERPERLNLSEADEGELIRAHRHMRLAARRLAPLLPVGLDTGIVTTGGIELFPALLVSLRMLRRTGCSLPVQVFVGDQEEYEAVRPVCEDVLPTLNAWCHIVSDIYSQAIATPPNHFQFKVLAILYSSFRHILFLDADAFPVHDPTALLNVRYSTPLTLPDNY
jgi:alpha 1,2-mannosyltransferase